MDEDFSLRAARDAKDPIREPPATSWCVRFPAPRGMGSRWTSRDCVAPE
jgi:hypothetical protein